MKRLSQIFALFLLVFSILSLAVAIPNTAQAQGSVDIVLDPSTSNVEVNDVFSVNVMVQANTQKVNTVGVYLDFDPNVLQVISLTDGGIFPYVFESAFHNTLGQIDFAAGIFDSSEPSGTFTLVTLKFKAIAPTTSTPLSFVYTPEERRTDALYETSVLHEAIDGDVTISAPNYELTVDVEPDDSGTVTLNPSGGTYTAGTEVQLTANPTPGWEFSGWSGDLSGETNPATITMDGNKTVTANFAMIQTDTLGIKAWLLEGSSNQGKTCAELAEIYADPGTTWVEFKLEGGNLTTGSHSDGTLAVTLANLTMPDKRFDWTSNIGVDAIVVKDGEDGANFYVYDGLTSPLDGTTGTSDGTWRDSEATGDTDLTTPNDGNKDISHISFCYDPEQQTGTLTVIKEVVNDNGGTAVVSDFALFIDGNPVVSGAVNPVDAGTYTVSETNLAGYVGTFSGDCDASGNVSVGLGEHKTCTITNNDQAASLTVVKEVVNDNGGTAVVSDFALFIDGNPVVSGAVNPVDAGTYTVSETNLAGYVGTFSGDCDASGNVSVGLGEHKTCVITNNDQESEPDGDVSISKKQKTDDSAWTTDPLSVLWGDTISYSLTMTNTFEEAVDLMIGDALSGLVDYVGGTLTGAIYEGNTLVNLVDVGEAIFSDGWWFSGLDAGQTLLISFDVVVLDEDIVAAGSWIENMAWIDGYINQDKVIDHKWSNTVRSEVVPEPATVFFFGIGLLGMFALLRRRRR